MKRSVQTKIDKLIALSKEPTSKKAFPKEAGRGRRDGLSESIRTERDAEIFRKELGLALTASGK